MRKGGLLQVRERGDKVEDGKGQSYLAFHRTNGELVFRHRSPEDTPGKIILQEDLIQADKHSDSLEKESFMALVRRGE